MNQYHVTQPGGSPHGPYTRETLQVMAMRGEVNHQTLCFTEGMPEWAPIATVLPGVIPMTQGDAKPKVAYILLGLFIGGLGIHNFYAGYVGRGVAQLLLTLLSCGTLFIVVFIWNIIEICTVTTDAKGVPFS